MKPAMNTERSQPRADSPRANDGHARVARALSARGFAAVLSASIVPGPRGSAADTV